jgi:thiol:disulfide interchange protein
MTRFLPTIRSWLALALAAFAAIVYPMLLPVRFVASGGPIWLAEPVSPTLWVLGGLLAFLCVGACVEAFRRGSRADRVVACIAALLTISFITGFCDLLLLQCAPMK